MVFDCQKRSLTKARDRHGNKRAHEVRRAHTIRWAPSSARHHHIRVHDEHVDQREESDGASCQPNARDQSLFLRLSLRRGYLAPLFTVGCDGRQELRQVDWRKSKRLPNARPPLEAAPNRIRADRIAALALTLSFFSLTARSVLSLKFRSTKKSRCCCSPCAPSHRLGSQAPFVHAHVAPLCAPRRQSVLAAKHAARRIACVHRGTRLERRSSQLSLPSTRHGQYEQMTRQVKSRMPDRTRYTRYAHAHIAHMA